MLVLGAFDKLSHLDFMAKLTQENSETAIKFGQFRFILNFNWSKSNEFIDCI